MIRRIVPIVLIFMCTTGGWVLLNESALMRSLEQDDKLEKAAPVDESLVGIYPPAAQTGFRQQLLMNSWKTRAGSRLPVPGPFRMPATRPARLPTRSSF